MNRPKRQLELRGGGTFLYVLQAQAGDQAWLKIGLSREPEARVTSIQNGCPLPILEMWCIEIESIDHAELSEALCHNELADSRGCGEWFAGVITSELLERLLRGPLCGAIDGVWQNVSFAQRQALRLRTNRAKLSFIERKRKLVAEYRAKRAAGGDANELFNRTPLDQYLSCYKSR